MNTIKSFLVLILSVLVHAGFAQTWIQTSAPTLSWSAVACSADGTKIVAAATITNSDGSIYVSTNSGATWTKTIASTSFPPSVSTSWKSVASSADGTTLVAASAEFYHTKGSIYTSTNSGDTWISNNVPDNIPWVSVACSADGSALAAASPGKSGFAGRVYTSTNSGVTWTSNSLPNQRWTSIASSADGTRLIAAGETDTALYTSTNSGITWTYHFFYYNPWRSVACSPDGVILVAAAGSTPIRPPRIFVSTNSGQTWQTSAAPVLSWVSVVSAGESEFIAVSSEGLIFISTDSGMNWKANGGLYQHCSAIASSRDRNNLVATSDNGYRLGGGIFTYTVPFPPPLNLAVSGQNMVISWPWPSADFVLQKNSDLSISNWTDVTNAPAVLNQVILSPTGDSEFYRLEAR